MNDRARSALRTFLAPLHRRAVSAYVAGSRIEDTLPACRALEARGRTSTVGYWNRRGDEPRQVALEYLAALDALAQRGFDSCLSIKAPALGFSPELVAELLERTRSAGVRVHFDSLHPETAERTIALMVAATRQHDELGITLPAGWRRSPADAGTAVELGLGVRVVKGQWPEPATSDPDLRASFLTLVQRLAGRARRVAVATHDEALAREALRRLQAAGTPCELELLFGLPARAAARAADELSVPVRVYVPYGHASLPYRIADVRGDARVLSWLLQDLLQGRRKGWRALPGRGGAGALRLGLAANASTAAPSGSRAQA